MFKLMRPRETNFAYIMLKLHFVGTLQYQRSTSNLKRSILKSSYKNIPAILDVQGCSFPN